MKTEYAICVTRSYYGPETKKTRLFDHETGREWRGTRAEARAKIEELEESWREWPELQNNEAAAPAYTIIQA